MTRFAPGQDVSIPCVFARGALPGELCVTLESADGLMSGFVRSEYLVGSDDRGFVRGRVVQGEWMATTGFTEDGASRAAGRRRIESC